MKDKINTDEFLKYVVENEISNFSFIKSIKINKKSISCKISDDYLNVSLRCDFYTNEKMLRIILKHLSNFIKENQIDYPYDMDFLEYKFKKIYFNKIK